MKVLHYVDCASLSWEVPYIAHMKAMAGLGVEQTLLCRAGDNLERLARENGIPVRTWKPLIPAVPLLSPNCRRHCGSLAFQTGDPDCGHL